MKNPLHASEGHFSKAHDNPARRSSLVHAGRGWQVCCLLAGLNTAFQFPLMQVTIFLAEGVTWSAIGVISLWCEDFAADFGHVELRDATPAQRAEVLGAGGAAAAPTAAAALPPITRSTPLAAPPLANCAVLTGSYRVHWEVGIDCRRCRLTTSAKPWKSHCCMLKADTGLPVTAARDECAKPPSSMPPCCRGRNAEPAGGQSPTRHPMFPLPAAGQP